MNPKNSKVTELWFPDNSDSPCTLLLDLSRASAEGTEPSPQYYCRTWDPTTKDPGVRVGILDPNRLTHQTAFLGGSGITHHFWVMEKPPSWPLLWNAGFAGLKLSTISKQLFTASYPWMVKWALQASAWTDDERLLALTKLLVAHADASLPPVDKTEMLGRLPLKLSLRLITYRSHYESIRARTIDPKAMDTAVNRAFMKYQDELLRWSQSLTCSSSYREKEWSSPNLSEWSAIIYCHLPQIRQLLSGGGLTVAGTTREDIEASLGHSIPDTRFHERLDPAMQYYLNHDQDFTAYRFCTGFLYSNLYSLGIPLRLRYLVCGLAARFNEELSDTTWRDLRDLFHEAATVAYYTRDTDGSGIR